jgi:hypothetical protein
VCLAAVHSPDVKLDAEAIEVLWVAVRDLVQPSQSQPTRQLTLAFTCKLLEARAGPPLTTLTRASIFGVVRSHEMGADTPLILELFIELTGMGRDLAILEAHIGAVLMDILPTCLELRCVHRLLQLLRGIFEVNFALLDASSAQDLVFLVCHLCMKSSEAADVADCLSTLETLIGARAVSEHVTPHHLAVLSTLNPGSSGCMCVAAVPSSGVS